MVAPLSLWNLLNVLNIADHKKAISRPHERKTLMLGEVGKMLAKSAYAMMVSLEWEDMLQVLGVLSPGEDKKIVERALVDIGQDGSSCSSLSMQSMRPTDEAP